MDFGAEGWVTTEGTEEELGIRNEEGDWGYRMLDFRRRKTIAIRMASRTGKQIICAALVNQKERITAHNFIVTIHEPSTPQKEHTSCQQPR